MVEKHLPKKNEPQIFFFLLGLHGLPTRTGKLKDLSSFDATFFGVHAKQAHVMDAQLRKLLELTHEAIIDAGKLTEYSPHLSTKADTFIIFQAFQNYQNAMIDVLI